MHVKKICLQGVNKALKSSKFLFLNVCWNFRVIESKESLCVCFLIDNLTNHWEYMVWLDQFNPNPIFKVFYAFMDSQGTFRIITNGT